MNTIRARKGRQARASALRALGAGQLSLRDAIWDGHGALETCPIHRVMEATRGLGPEGTRRVLERAGIWPLEPLHKLGKNQRREILHHLPERIE